ncbi:uncharacterized protein LOC123498201 [Portunus trituberculatus]|uniref:uncharacterized protein LOC123498201 n=1 Tax=Portunus trituberculatus TaxID=210409 RepID=UPI001E1CFB47|nr:uncharacterized protein LOC123498201 [Portunus trituberculatus]
MRWQPRITSVTTISGDTFRCTGVGEVSVETPAGLCARLEALVVSQPPLGADVVLGIAGIEALGGVTVKSASDVQFCGAGQRRLCGTAAPAPLVVDAPDFSVQFNTVSRTWIVTWKWTNGAAPDCLGNTVEQYNVPLSMRQAFCQELESWITSGWLVPHDEQHLGGLLPLMAVRQNNGGKVRPVLDYRELNDCVTAFTADSDVCSDQLRKWRRHGENVSVLDLRKAYLQVRVDQQLWPFQTVMVRGRRYCLTRLGFGLNIAPQVMKAVVKTILAQDSKIEQAVLPYVDDLLVNEDLVSAEQLRVNAVAAPPKQVTRRAVFAWCGRLIAHLPVGGWLRPAVAWIKRQVNASTRGWDDVTGDDALCEQMEYVSSRLSKEDPCCGQWCVHGDQAVVWTDASSIAAGVVVETPQGAAIEDACWIRRDESSHINMAELDAAVRGVNLAIAWGMRTIDLRTDSATVYRWIDDALSGRARLRTKAHGEMLIRRRVDVIRQLVTELELVMSVTLVRSSENRADALTRVPGMTRAEARATVRQCEVCRKIDPAPAKWQHGSLSVTETWWRLATDVTHYLGSAYLSLVDCGPSRFAAWRHLRRPDADTVVSHLEQVFCERGAPAELLCDNDTVFRGRRFAAFAARWGVSLRFRGAYVERNHRTVKVIAARKGCSVAEAVHLYNVTPRDGETVASAPVSGIYRYRVRDCVRHDQVQRAVHTSPDVARKNYTVDDAVWVRRRGERCTSASQPGVVTRDLRHRSSLLVHEAGTPDEPGVDDEPPLHVDAQSQLLQPQVAEPPPEAPREAVLRRSTRERHPPQRYCCDPGDQGGV